MYESTYRCDRCGKQIVFSIDHPNHEEAIRQERCPVGERNRKIIKKLVDNDTEQGEMVIRRNYGFTKAKLEKFKKTHHRIIRQLETKKYGKIFAEEL
jgi:DNA-directed RNA polymerase subunit RPC12/RpoP